MTKYILALLGFSLLLGCSSQFAAGEGSSTEVVIGGVLDVQGNPISRVVATLYPADYNPIKDTAIILAKDTTNARGEFSFEGVSFGKYTVICSLLIDDSVTFGGIVMCTVSTVRDTFYAAVTLAEMVEEVIAVPDSLVDTARGYVYLPGTNYFINVQEAVRVDGYHNFTFSAVPQGVLPGVNVASYNSLVDESVIQEELQSYKPVWYEVMSVGVDPLINVSRIVQDVAGDIWFGNTYSLIRLKNYNQWTQYDTAGDMVGPIFDLEAAPNGGVWLANDFENISYFDGVSWIRYDSLDFNPIGDVACVAPQSADTVWFGSQNGKGPFRYIKSSDTWTSVTIPGSGAENVVFDIVFQGGVFWAATATGCAEYNGGVWTPYSNATMGFLGTYPRNLDIVPNDGVWFSSDGGLSHFNGNSWTLYDTLNSDLHTNKLYEVTHDKSGRIYVATTEGLASFYGGVWKEHSGDAGTPPTTSDVLFSVMQDRDGNIWACGTSVFVMGPTAIKYSGK